MDVLVRGEVTFCTAQLTPEKTTLLLDIVRSDAA